MLRAMNERTPQQAMNEPQASQSAARIAPAKAIAPRPPVWRRTLAAMIDRVAPLPFLAFFFPKWMLAVVAWHLLCNCTPDRRSFGKQVCRLRVVSATSGKPCQWWQAALRSAGIAITQAAWCLWAWIPVVLLYELGSLACVLLSPEGRRPEDYLTGTRVITEKTHRRNQPQQ